MIIIRKKILVTLDVYYWMPDYQNILQRFVWQTMDTKPKYPRVHKFLNHWHNWEDKKLLSGATNKRTDQAMANTLAKETDLAIAVGTKLADFTTGITEGFAEGVTNPVSSWWEKYGIWVYVILGVIGFGVLLWLLRPLFSMIGAFKGGSP